MNELINLVPQLGVAIGIILISVFLTKFLVEKKASQSLRPPAPAKLLHDPDLSAKLDSVLKRVSEPPPSRGCEDGMVEECKDRFDGIERKFDAIEGKIDSHGTMHRKQFRAIASLREGQNTILEHLTNGGPKSPRKHDPINYDIDLEKTGEVHIEEVPDRED